MSKGPARVPRSLRAPRLVAAALRADEASYGAALVSALDASGDEVAAALAAVKASTMDTKIEVYLAEQDERRVLGRAKVWDVKPGRAAQALLLIAAARLASANTRATDAARAYLDARRALVAEGVEPALAELTAIDRPV